MRVIHARSYSHTFAVIELATAVNKKWAMNSRCKNTKKLNKNDMMWVSEWVNKLFILGVQEIK